ncbi:arfaptin-1 isoform X2 [Dunckerocampus dactyliophorus]|uniref:arfaptin-1 isoform X2 n=1 Tax=Dunckerocampus dactyliophorus TaxID=161453 RepID=UPI0024051DC6|nr:arfaptin-1 isoform X2 [Dunckerocampus dactyliophorus]
MSESSRDTDSGKMSAEESQEMDCHESEGSLSGGSPQPSVGDSKDSASGDDGDNVLYEIDIDDAEEKSVGSGEDVEGCGGEAAGVENDEGEAVGTADMPDEGGDDATRGKENAMAQEPQMSSTAAEIAVTSNGDLDQSPASVFRRDSYPGESGVTDLPESCIPSSNFASTTEGIIESGPYKGTPNTQPTSGALVLSDDIKNPAMEKLDLVRKWSINTYKCTRQILSERLGRGSKTVDLELEAQIEVLRENKRKYQNVIKLAQTLATQLSQVMQTQRQLGDAFADLSLKSPELHEEFGYNADTQKLLSKNGETLLGAINFFISSVNTLVDKTIEDTMINIKQYEIARVEYDAYRTDLEELNLGPRDTTTMPKIEQSQQVFQIYREKYERMRNDVSVKLKFLEENKVKVLHNQLILFHNAIAAYYSGNQQQLEQTLQQFHIKLKMPGGEQPSWLEEN